MVPQLRPRFAVWFFAVLAATLVLLASLTPTAQARTVRFKSVDQRGATFVFKPSGISPSRIRRAWVTVGGRKLRRVHRKRVIRSAKRRSRLRVVLGPGLARTLYSRTWAARSGSGRLQARAMLVIKTRGKRRTGRAAGCGSAVFSAARLGGGRTPGACWRPYAASSPFNRELPAQPRISKRSRSIVSKMVRFGPMEHLRAGQAGAKDDWGHPTYYSRPSDPEFTVHCSESWGRCDIEGAKVRIPDAAKVPRGDDGHMTVVDQASGWEYDMWRVQRKPRGGGTITAAWGGRTRIDGNGLGSDAVAAQFGTMAGKLRAEELEAGEINHALFMTVKCDSGRSVYPATKAGRPCSSIGISNADAPPMGTRLQLDMSSAEINALKVPAWKKTILRAAAEYGFIVGDTGGTFGIKEEGGLTYTSFGKSDKWVELAKKWNVPYYAPDGRYVFNLRDGVDWKNKLRVIEPCVSEGRC